MELISKIKYFKSYFIIMRLCFVDGVLQQYFCRLKWDKLIKLFKFHYTIKNCMHAKLFEINCHLNYLLLLLLLIRDPSTLTRKISTTRRDFYYKINKLAIIHQQSDHNIEKPIHNIYIKKKNQCFSTIFLIKIIDKNPIITSP